MDKQTLTEEYFRGQEVLPEKECCDFLEDNAIKRKVFGFEGELCGIYHESATEKGTLEIRLYSIITRELTKCTHCNCYHEKGYECPPAVKVGPL